MNTKEVLKQLIKIADNQQKIINKLAQHLPSEDISTFTPGAHHDTDLTPVPQHLSPNMSSQRPAALILAALDPQALALLVNNKIEVDGNAVVAFTKPGLPDKTLDAMQRYVSNIVNKVLPVGQYTVSVQEVV